MSERTITRDPLTAARTELIRARFEKTLGVIVPGVCCEWPKARNSEGYGVTSIRRQIYLAHRVAWVLAHGEIPVGLHVCHHCDNPACCNPGDLFLGDDAANLADMRAKGRGRLVGEFQKEGVEHHNAKLTPDAAREIRASIAAGLSRRVLAARFKVSKGTIDAVAYGITWKAA